MTQDKYLNELRKTKTPLTVFLVNGFQLRGIIESFDNFVIMMNVENKQQMIYKHAISTIVPSKPVSLDV